MQLLSLLSGCLVSTVVYASPFPSGANVESRAIGTFSVNQVAGDRKVTQNGPQAYLRTLEKYHLNIPTGARNAAAGRVNPVAAAASGVVTATPQPNDVRYLCPVQIGTPAQTLNLDFDTGSSDTWVFSSQQPSAQRTGHSYYTSGASSTSKLLSGYKWSIQYFDNSGASGNVYTDKVTIGGVTATTQAVEAATTVSADFTQDVDVDGFVGLALSTLNMVTPNRQYTFFDNVKSSLAQPLFAAWLRKGAPGVYDFGFTDSTKYSGTIGYVPVNVTYGEWQFATGVYSVGSTNYASLGDAFADSGTSLIALPDPAVANYYKAVSGAVYDTGSAAYLFPCTATLPSFSLTIGGVKRTVPGSLLNYATYGSGYCYGGIQSNQNYGLAILGDVFFKSQYVVFRNTGTPSIGFAPQK